MITSRGISRRGFCYATLLAGIAPIFQPSRLTLPKRRFKLGNRVKVTWVCDDDRSPNFGNPEWECGLIVGYCWQFPDWRNSEFRSGWTYWIRFDDSNDRKNLPEPYTDFQHEDQLTIA